MKRDQASSLPWIGLAIFICEETLRKLPLGSLSDPGPGFLPLIAGTIIGILALSNFLISTIRETSKDWSWFPRRWRTLGFILVALFAWAFLLETLGFLVGTFLMMASLFFEANPQRWFLALGGSAILVLATYLIFDVWLLIQLPRGIWGF